jgi:hypothetical protein
VVKPGITFLVMAHPYSVGANTVTTPNVESVAQNPDYKLTRTNLRGKGSPRPEVKNSTYIQGHQVPGNPKALLHFYNLNTIPYPSFPLEGFFNV